MGTANDAHKRPSCHRQAAHGLPIVLNRLFHRCHVSFHELIDGRAEDLAEQQKALHIGVGAVSLPIGNGLARYENALGHVLLGQPQPVPMLLEMLLEFHNASFRDQSDMTRRSVPPKPFGTTLQPTKTPAKSL